MTRGTRLHAALFAPGAIVCALALVAVTGGVGSSAIAVSGQQPGVIAAYSLAAPRTETASGLVARAVVPAGSTCPTLDVVSSRAGHLIFRKLPMRIRSAPATTYPAFAPITVCSTPVPLGAVDATVAGRVIPARLPSSIERLAMFGDSGCRIVEIEVQDCASADAWPLAQISAGIAKEQPDAVIFNGDFFYREAPCPAGSQAECGSSPPQVAGLPITDSAYGWIADVLMPMTPLLSVAPLVMTRGNHEACYRGGNGYFLLFDPRSGTESTCAPVMTAAGLVAAPTVPTATYAIDLQVNSGRALRLAIVDSAGGSDTSVTSFAADQRPAYQAAATLTSPRKGRESWLLTHRPVYAFVSDTFAKPGKEFNPWTSMDQAAAAYGLLGNYDLVMSSHVHLVQAVQLPGLPGQLVLGNGGTLLDPAVGYPLPTSGATVGSGQSYPAPTSAWVQARFGYAMAYPNADAGSWRMEMLDPLGERFARCGVDNREIYCVDTQ